MYAYDANFAKVLFLIACIALCILGIVAVIQKATLQGLAWIAVALVVLGFYNLTP